MKINKLLIIVSSLVVLIVLYFLFGSYVTNVMIKTSEEARIAEITLPTDSRSLELHLDVVQNTNLKWKNAVLIQGWVFNKKSQQEKRDLYFVLKSKRATFIYKIEKSGMKRPDVTRAYHLAGNVNNHGFELKIPVYLLKSDTCSIGVVLEDATGKYFTMTNKAITISNGNVTVLQSEEEASAVSNKVEVTPQKSTKPVKFFFDKVDLSNNKLTIVGWCYLDGLDAIGQTTYVQLKNNEKTGVFNTQVMLRKDVTQAYGKNVNNLDSCGFFFQSPLGKLDAGTYQIGLYIVKGSDAGSIISEKKVTIAKPQ